VTRPKKKGISPELEYAVAKLLREVMADQAATLTDKMKVIDRSLKLEAIRLKADTEDWGAAFAEDEDD
jgi:hypothetical protein